MYALVLKSILKKTLLFIISIYLSLLIIETFLIYTDLDRKSVYLDLNKIISQNRYIIALQKAQYFRTLYAFSFPQTK